MSGTSSSVYICAKGEWQLEHRAHCVPPWIAMVRATWWRLCTHEAEEEANSFSHQHLYSHPNHGVSTWQWLLLLLLFGPRAGVPGVWQGWGSLVKTFVYWARKEVLGKDIREARPHSRVGGISPKMCQSKFIGNKSYSISYASLDPLTIWSTRNQDRTTLSSGASPTLLRQAFTS